MLRENLEDVRKEWKNVILKTELLLSKENVKALMNRKNNHAWQDLLLPDENEETRLVFQLLDEIKEAPTHEGIDDLMSAIQSLRHLKRDIGLSAIQSDIIDLQEGGRSVDRGNEFKSMPGVKQIIEGSILSNVAKLYGIEEAKVMYSHQVKVTMTPAGGKPLPFEMVICF